MTKIHVLFLCTGNSCRSQMAEGWAQHFHGNTIEAYSAGIEAHGLKPDAIKVMAEAVLFATTFWSFLREFSSLTVSSSRTGRRGCPSDSGEAGNQFGA